MQVQRRGAEALVEDVADDVVQKAEDVAAVRDLDEEPRQLDLLGCGDHVDTRDVQEPANRLQVDGPPDDGCR